MQANDGMLYGTTREGGTVTVSLLNCGVESLQRREPGEQIVEIALGQPVDTEDRHCRCLAVGHLADITPQESLDALTTIHDLHREQIVVLPDAAHGLAVLQGDQITGS